VKKRKRASERERKRRTKRDGANARGGEVEREHKKEQKVCVFVCEREKQK